MRYWRTPMDSDRVTVPQGDVNILPERCKGCEFCTEYCPKDVLAMSTGFNRKGYHFPEVVKEGVCLNCNLCEVICPEFAIFTVEVERLQPAGTEEVTT
jgi:2-oxoglutarate ferredoxin oxidoreductase subunit delta